MAKQPASSPGIISISSNLEVPTPRASAGIAVSLGAWDMLKDRIKNCGDSSNRFENAGWACIGFAGSAFLTALSFPFGVPFTTDGHSNLYVVVVWAIFLGLFLGCLVGGIIALLLVYKNRRTQQTMMGIVLADMEFIEASQRPIQAASQGTSIPIPATQPPAIPQSTPASPPSI